MITFQNLYLDVRRRFLAAGFPGADLEARELVCCGSRKTRSEFYRDSPLYTSPEVEEAVRALAERHMRGEPVAYLIGEWEFYGLTLEVNESVLSPRIDTEVLAEAAIAYAGTAGKCRVLDLCAGSGCIGLAVAANVPESRVLLGELSEDALRVCRRNVRRCGLTERVKAEKLDALAYPPQTIGDFSCIVCNPPYITRADMETLDSSVKDFEPHIALCGGEDGLDFYRAVTRNWRSVLAENGRLYFEVGAGQADEVADLMRDGGFDDIHIIPDTQGIPRVVYGTVINEVSPMEFLDTDFLKNDEIQLVLEKTVEADPAKDWLPAYIFTIRDLKGEKMGACDLRIGHNLSVYYGGNIGYSVAEQCRGHHYAGKACKLLFGLARRHGMDYLIITCNPDNWPSRRTCEYLGGELLEIAELPEDNDMRVEDGATHKCIYRFDLLGENEYD